MVPLELFYMFNVNSFCVLKTYFELDDNDKIEYIKYTNNKRQMVLLGFL